MFYISLKINIGFTQIQKVLNFFMLRIKFFYGFQGFFIYLTLYHYHLKIIKIERKNLYSKKILKHHLVKFLDSFELFQNPS